MTTSLWIPNRQLLVICSTIHRTSKNWSWFYYHQRISSFAYTPNTTHVTFTLKLNWNVTTCPSATYLLLQPPFFHLFLLLHWIMIGILTAHKHMQRGNRKRIKRHNNKRRKNDKWKGNREPLLTFFHILSVVKNKMTTSRRGKGAQYWRLPTTITRVGS